MNKEQIKSKFQEKFQSEPIIVRSPGRINLIGEHTDYNDGFVFPAAIDKEIIFAMAENKLEKFRFYSFDLKEEFELALSDLKRTDCGWANYLLGVAAQFQNAGHQLKGVDCVFGGNIPIGAGLSSSAAIENGFGFGLNELFGFGESRMNMVKMSQKAEHEYAGVMCGIMDQFASMMGKENQAIKIDTRSLGFEYANIDLDHYRFVLCDTKVSHSLASSEYNTRRKECETGVEILRKYNDKITALRDVSVDLLEAHKNEFDTVVYKRCEFVVNENNRVSAAAEALEKGDMVKLGELIYQSHQGLSENYEVSCKELDFFVEIAKESPEVLGARMMGGGFGGCTINLVKLDGVEAFAERIKKAYAEKMDKETEIYVVKVADGTSIA